MALIIIYKNEYSGNTKHAYLNISCTIRIIDVIYEYIKIKLDY